MKLGKIMIFGIIAVSLFSCGAAKKLKQENAQLTQSKAKLAQDLKDCHDITTALMNDRNSAVGKNTDMQGRINDLNKQIDYLKQNSTQALKQMENMSVITSAQAASIRKSMDNLGAKDNYI